MISLNEFINNANSTQVNGIQNNQARQFKVEEKYDFFEKENKTKKQNNKKRNIVIASTVAILLAFLAILKRNDISKLFNKQPQMPIKPVETNVPIKSKPFERLFKLYETDFSAVKKMQQAFDDLTIRKDDKALNCGVGFISESLEKRQKAMNAFVDELNKEGYETIKIPTTGEMKPDEIGNAINLAIQTAKEKFHQTGKRSVLVIRDMDVLGKENNTGVAFKRNVLKLEGTKKDGIAWVWDAKTNKPIDDSIIKSSPFMVLLDKMRRFRMDGIDECWLDEMQQAFDDLTIRKDDKALNCGVGFISESLEKRQKAMNTFVDELNKEGYETVEIPSIHEALPDKIAEAIENAKNRAIEKFHQTGKRSVLVIRDMDILASKSDDKFNICVAAIKDIENTKKDGVAWVWDAKSCDKICQPIFGKRTTHKVKLDKIIDKK